MRWVLIAVGLSSCTSPSPEDKCNKGDFASCVNVGSIAERASDYSRAATFFDRACVGGNGDGCFYLAMLARNGLAGQKDSARVVALMKQACDLKTPVACHNLGVWYTYGSEGDKSLPMAREYLQRACSSNREESCQFLRELETRFDPTLPPLGAAHDR